MPRAYAATGAEVDIGKLGNILYVVIATFFWSSGAGIQISALPALKFVVSQ
jgi:hypothetical protein